MKIKADGYDLHMLSLELSHANCRDAKLNMHIAALFGRDKVLDWTGKFELAADLFKTEFPDWSRECLYNSCNGISWHVRHDETDVWFPGSGETDALALCCAMVKAKREEDDWL